jgi:hypothetical protein
VNKVKKILGKVKAPQLLVVLVLGLSLVAGCATPQQNPYTYTGAGLGAALGAGIGAAANNRNPLKGAAIGALLGAAGGGIAGEVYGRNNPYPQPQPQGYYYPLQPSPSPAPVPQSQGYYQSAPQPGYSYAPPANPNYN